MADKEFTKWDGKPILHKLPSGSWGVIVGARYYVFTPSEGLLSDMGKLTTEMLREVTGQGPSPTAGFSDAAQAIRESSAKRQVSEVPNERRVLKGR
jgi:hypothetical protein